VALSHTPSLISDEFGVVRDPVFTFSEAMFQLCSIDLLAGTSSVGYVTPLWTVFPVLPSDVKDPLVSFVRLILRSSSEMSLIVGSVDGNTYTWTVPMTVTPTEGQHNGAVLVRVSDSRTLRGDISSMSLFPAAGSDTGLVGFVGSSASSSSSSSSSSSRSSSSSSSRSSSSSSRSDGQTVPITVIADPVADSSPEQIALSSSLKCVAEGTDCSYLHRFDHAKGELSLYKMSDRTCSNKNSSSTEACLFADLVSTTVFSPSAEKVVGFSYPNPTDTTYSRATLLGDDSVLLKYSNPATMLVSSLIGSKKSVETEFYQPEEGSNVTASSNGAMLVLTLLDIVSGNVIKRITHPSAALPVRTLLVENTIIATYWNSQNRRAELSVSALYDGAIDRQQLVPLVPAQPGVRKYEVPTVDSEAVDGTRGVGTSSYSLFSPMAIQRTYTLPRPVSSLAHTVTAKGIANKDIMMGFLNGQVFNVDLRHIHPRRPMQDPTPAEKAEGLMRYSPFVLLMPEMSAMTLNYTMGGGPARIVSQPSSLESTSLVISFGGRGLDFHHKRVMPSKSFDQLPKDFNYALLILILGSLAFAVVLLKWAAKNKQLSQLWA
jgi:hypothetical protein